MADMYVQHPINHNGVTYKKGDLFPVQDAATLEPLLAVGAIGTAAAVMPEKLEAIIARLESENAALKAELESLRTQAQGRGKRTTEAE